MAKIIGVIQVKGGAGRSTLSTNLAGELSKLGATTLIDADLPQGTAQSWYAMRQEAGRSGDMVSQLKLRTAADYLDLMAAVEDAGKESKFILIDCPPRTAKLTRAALMLADLVLIPCGASKPELWATLDIQELLQEAEQAKPVKARLVWTRYRAGTRLAQDLTEMASKELGIKAMDTRLGMRVSYMEALGDGLTAAEVGDPQARAEVEQLVHEVQQILKTRKK